MKGFDVQRALNDGHSYEDIARHLAAESELPYERMIKDGYTPEKIAELLAPAPSFGAARNVGMGALHGAANIGKTLLWPADAMDDVYARLHGETTNNHRARGAAIDAFFDKNANPDSGAFAVGSGGANLAGTAGPLGAAGKALQAAGVGPWLSSMALGAGSGAVDGAAGAGSAAEIPREALTHAATGAVAAPVIQAGAKVVTAPVMALAQALLTRAPWLGEKLSGSLAARRIGEALLRDKVEAGNVPARMAALGPEARMVDAGDANTRSLLDVNAVLPGETGPALLAAQRSRIAGRPERLDPIADSMNSGMGRMGPAMRRMEAEQKANAAPLYLQAHSLNIPVDEDLGGILDAAHTLGAFKHGESIATARRLPFTLSKEALDSAEEAGMPAVASMRDLDHVKQGLDQLVSKETKPNGSLTPLGAAYDELRRSMLTALDVRTGGVGNSIYAKAREAYAGPARFMDAINAGNRFLNEGDDAIKIDLGDFGNSEKDAYRIGAAEALRKKFGSQGGQTEFINAWKNRNLRESLAATFDDPKKMSDTMALLHNEEHLKEMERLGHGSQTMGRESAAEDQTAGVGEDLMSLGHNAVTLNAPGLWSDINRFSTRLGTPESVRNRIGELLLDRDPMSAGIIEAAQDAVRRQRVAAAVAAGAAGGGAASVIGAPTLSNISNAYQGL